MFTRGVFFFVTAATVVCLCPCGALMCVSGHSVGVSRCLRLLQDSQSKQGGYSMHQLQGNKEFGSEKKGYLLKKSDG